MSKSVSVDDETYQIIADFANEDDRPLANALSRLVKLGRDFYKNRSVPQVEVKNDGFVEVQPKNENQSKITELLRRRGDIIWKLRDENISRVIQQQAAEEHWSDEQGAVESANMRENLQMELEEVDEELHSLGV